MSIPENLKQLKLRAVSNQPGIFGACTLFDGDCTDNQLLSMFTNQTELNQFVLLFPPTPTKNYRKTQRYISQTALSGQTAGADPNCDVPTGTYEQALCDLECVFDNADKLAVSGPTRQLSQVGGLNCDTRNFSGRFIDGSLITSTAQQDKFVITQQLTGLWANWLYTRLKTGINDAVAGLTGNCEPLRPAVIDVGGVSLTDTTTTKLWNGATVPAAYTFMDLLQTAVRRILDLKRQTPLIANVPIEYGDVVLVTSRAMAQCILDAYVCFKHCPDAVILNETALRVRAEIQANSQFFADLEMDGFTVPLIVNDVVEPSVAMLLVREMGALRMIEHEAWDWRVPASATDALAVQAQSNAVTYENGTFRGLTYFSPNDDCYSEKLWAHPRVCLPGIAFQTLFIGMNCQSAYTPTLPTFTYPGCPVVVTPQAV